MLTCLNIYIYTYIYVHSYIYIEIQIDMMHIWIYWKLCPWDKASRPPRIRSGGSDASLSICRHPHLSTLFQIWLAATIQNMQSNWTNNHKHVPIILLHLYHQLNQHRQWTELKTMVIMLMVMKVAFTIGNWIELESYLEAPPWEKQPRNSQLPTRWESFWANLK